jgi:hypothetical protein
LYSSCGEHAGPRADGSGQHGVSHCYSSRTCGLHDVHSRLSRPPEDSGSHRNAMHSDRANASLFSFQRASVLLPAEPLVANRTLRARNQIKNPASSAGSDRHTRAASLEARLISSRCPYRTSGTVPDAAGRNCIPRFGPENRLSGEVAPPDCFAGLQPASKYRRFPRPRQARPTRLFPQSRQAVGKKPLSRLEHKAAGGAQATRLCHGAN